MLVGANYGVAPSHLLFELQRARKNYVGRNRYESMKSDPVKYEAHKHKKRAYQRNYRRYRLKNDPDFRARRNADGRARYERLRPQRDLLKAKKRAEKPAHSSTRSREISREYREIIVRALAGRDGWGCWRCGVLLEPLSGSPDHVVSPLDGGQNCLENMKLACRPCNIRGGVELRQKRRGQRGT